jgi:hypothetical protein
MQILQYVIKHLSLHSCIKNASHNKIQHLMVSFVIW